MIELTKTVVENEFSENQAEVVYGDTDSVMINFHVESIGEAMQLGKKAADIVNVHFQKPINLAFEKVYCPYLLINKKRYIGGFWTDPEKMHHVDAKGVESVRRDNCQMVSDAVKIITDILMIEKDTIKAIEYAKQLVSDVLQYKIDMSKLVITKAYTKKAEEYKSKQAHVELVKRIQLRTPDQAPQIGDRIPYVIIPGIKNSKMYERVEDPLYVLEKEIPLDTTYYLDNQLKKPLLRIFAPILSQEGESEEKSKTRANNMIFTGEHTRTIVKLVPKNVGIAQYCVKTPRNPGGNR